MTRNRRGRIEEGGGRKQAMERRRRCIRRKGRQREIKMEIHEEQKSKEDGEKEEKGKEVDKKGDR